MDGWRGLLGAALQWTLLFPFLGLCLLILSIVPTPQAPDPALVGRWSSTLADEWAGKPLIDLVLMADEHFELTLYHREAGRNPAHVQGDYRILHGALVLRVDGQRMLWRVLARGGALTHRTDAGQAFRLERPEERASNRAGALLQLSDLGE